MALLELDAAGDRGVDRGLSAGVRGGVCLTAPDGDRRAARAGGCGDRGGGRRRTGWPGGSRSMWPRIIRSSTRSCPTCVRRWRIWRRSAPAIPIISTTSTTPAARCSTPSIGRPTCVNPVRFSRGNRHRGRRAHATFIEISPHPLLTHAITETLGDAHHHSLGTLQRDTDDTLTFHTNLNTTHTTHPPHTDHPPGPHPCLPTTPWHHTHHWIASRRPPRHPRVSAPKGGNTAGRTHLIVSIDAGRPPVAGPTLPEAKPYPGYHRLHGVEVVPASVLLPDVARRGGRTRCIGTVRCSIRAPDRHRPSRRSSRLSRTPNPSVLPPVRLSTRPPTDGPRHVTARLSPIRIPGGGRFGPVRAQTTHRPGPQHPSESELLQARGVEGQPFSWSIDSYTPTSTRPGTLVYG